MKAARKAQEKLTSKNSKKEIEEVTSKPDKYSEKNKNSKQKVK